MMNGHIPHAGSQFVTTCPGCQAMWAEQRGDESMRTEPDETRSTLGEPSLMWERDGS
jgi:hypothetical protein